jgi:hypothetical protein
VIISVLVPLTRVPKRPTTGWLTKLLNLSTQQTKSKRNTWLKVGVAIVGTLSWLPTFQTRGGVYLWWWTSTSTTYRVECNNNPPSSVACMFDIASTSGRLHREFVRLYSYRLIGKLTAFLHVQEFSLHKPTVVGSTSDSRSTPHSSNLGSTWLSLKLQLYVLRLI